MKILHIIRNPNDATPLEIAEEQSRDHEVAVLLLHDAVYARPKLATFASASDADARGVTAHERVGYDRIVELLFGYDRVISW